MPQKAARTVRLRNRVGPYSKQGALSSLDRRSRPALFLKSYVDSLTAHVGGAPSATQRILIDRAARLALQIELMDERALASGKVSDSKAYLSWCNALRLCIRELGVRSAPERPGAALDEHLRRLGVTA